MKPQTNAPLLRCVTRLSVLLLLFTTLLGPTAAKASSPATVYTNDFEGAGGAEWSPAHTSVTPSGRGFLGEFGAETVTLTLNDLPAHSYVTLDFDFYALQTWDGSQEANGGIPVGPDIFEVAVTNGPTLVHSTFSNTENGSLPGDTSGPYPQSYPDPYPGPNHPPETGASEVDTLGYPWDGDSIYKFHFTFPHISNVLQVKFTGIGLQDLSDESWGLDNVIVYTDQQAIYANDFEIVTAVWSTPTLDVTPSGRRFLGQFGAETVTLTLNDLPAHSYVTLAFDFYAIQTWDGNQEFNADSRVGPDLFDLSVTGGPALLHTTFSNTEGGGLPGGQQGPYLQAYPGAYPGASYAPGTGASEIDTLGYMWDGDSVYNLHFTFPHTSNGLQINFAVSGTDYSESWGLDNVKVIVSTAAPQLFVSSSSSGKAGDVKFRDEDIIAYDLANNAWQIVFDGSDVGVTKDVDAFAFRPDGTLLLSFNAPTNVPGLGKVDDSDIVQFTPTQLGNDTAGSFTLYLRGADVGLTTDGEDIDAIAITAAGKIVVSTIGDFNTPTLAGKDEDLIQLDDASSGAWSMFLDGSAVGLANEDVNGFWLDIATGERYLTVKDSFAFSDGQATAQIDADDIFVCTPTEDGGCTYRRFWDSDGHAYGSENLDSIDLGTLPASFVSSVQASDIASPTLGEWVADDDSDDLNLEELINQLFLPLVER